MTLGSTVLSASSIAAPADMAKVGEFATKAARIPGNSYVAGATATGYLTVTHEGPIGGDNTVSTRQWVPADGSPARELTGAGEYASTGSGDLIAFGGETEAKLLDMATGQTRLTVPVEDGDVYAGAAGQALFTYTRSMFEARPLRMHTAATGTGTVTAGLPDNTWAVKVTAGTADHALLTYRTETDTTSTPHVALIDLATNTVSETHELPQAYGDATVSANHLAWVEYDWSDNATVVVIDRATKASQTFVVGTAEARDVEIAVIGGWITYGTRSGLSAWEPNSLNALTARSLQDGTTRKLLDHTISGAAAPDGAQIVRGGTVDQGEGLYRIAPGADGTPAATLVASSGESTKVALLDTKVPATIDLDQAPGKVRFEWRLSRDNVLATVTLRHVRTGKSIYRKYFQPDDGLIPFDWSGDLGNHDQTAFNGEYTWQIAAEPMNGIGPALATSGTFTVVRKPAPHDYNDNGTPDVVVRDGAGRLWRADSHYDPQLRPWMGSAEQQALGGGWGVYNQIEAAGNLAGADHADLLARDGAGVLWLYLGKGDGTFANRARVGAGWGVYTKIAAGSDLNSDGKPDLVATDTTGALWFYKGTGDWRTPYTSRVKIGTGWGIYNQLTATGDIAGAPAGDLLARDTAGVLWLYLGKGDGTFATRTRIGAGWNAYSHIVGIGDADRDGRPDLFATNSDDTKTYLYKGTGSWKAPLAPRQTTTMPNNKPTSVA
ncbi:FG-GAP repeat domain-containing protein [Streptomyces sp. NPDC048370]|uniref:FG-GAP repeat domain-containing protein n=1 Tax=Streptomyces sp. NPDC048370 TaxID=3365540 RepID=UPI00371E6174